MAHAKLLLVHTERKLQLAEQAGHRAWAHGDAEFTQLFGDIGGGFAHPSQAGHRVTGGVVFQ